MRKGFLPKIVLFFFGLALLLPFPAFTRADLVDDLKAKIEERNRVIAELEKEIALYEAQVEKTGAEATTLKSAVNALELTRKKLSAEIKVIENKISAASLSIKSLDSEINERQKNIDKNLGLITAMINKTNELESSSLLETLLNYPTISRFWDQVESLSELYGALREAVLELREERQELGDKKLEEEARKKELLTLSDNLTDKKKVAEYNKAKTAKLLADTKNKQSNYQKLLEQKIALRKAVEQELLDYESQLKFAIDPTSLPKSGSGVLRWPLDSVKITQEFGDTAFSRSHSALYNGRGHNGIDLKAALGTPVKAALSGKVLGTGDTDKTCPGASYGKWVLIEHENGLSTLYAHLSVIKVSSGEAVETGEVAGYSGDTGYATGPHLHFTVYASQGVAIRSFPSKVCRAAYTMPVASLNAYLNPLLYL